MVRKASVTSVLTILPYVQELFPILMPSLAREVDQYITTISNVWVQRATSSIAPTEVSTLSMGVVGILMMLEYAVFKV